jgi:hypothetical protein
VKDREPCPSCPWRVGVDAWAIGRDHAPEVPPLWWGEMVDMARRQTGGLEAPVMACHLTHQGEDKIPPHERTCVGFALSQEGGGNLMLRMLAMGGKVDLERYGCGALLHPDFRAMLAANPPRPTARRTEKAS